MFIQFPLSALCYYANAVTTDKALGNAEALTGSLVYKKEEVEQAGDVAIQLSQQDMSEDLAGKHI